MDSVNIKELNERIERESAFVDIIQMEMGRNSATPCTIPRMIAFRIDNGIPSRR